jgi:hypothetical protein
MGDFNEEYDVVIVGTGKLFFVIVLNTDLILTFKLQA